MMKRLIVCYDGTWNSPEKDSPSSNVVRMSRMISPSDDKGVVQSVYYDPGVGTGNFFDRWVGGAFGNGLEQKVKEGYLFLANNYEDGDEIYVFGFSRGAFSARSLAGFMNACGGLLKGERGLDKINEAWLYYRQKPANRDPNHFRLEMGDHINKSAAIDYLGVWDTVGALGIPWTPLNLFNAWRYSFHDTQLSKIVKNAFQALAIDEHRGPFRASLWEEPKPPIANQIVEQVWFPGAHASIGGGYLNSSISDLALRWMMKRAMANTGLQFTAEALGYFIPEAAERKFVDGATEKAQGHIRDKWKGPLYNSTTYYYPISRLCPRMRTINNEVSHQGVGIIKKFFLTTGRNNAGVFEEAIHWSAVWRVKQWKAEGLEKYDPPNLRMSLDEIRAGTLKVVEMEDESKIGVGYWKG
jgi:hypothetical protein